MMPNREKIALAYLYFIPKPHKIIFEPFLLRYYSLFCLFFIARNTTKTNCIFDEYSNNCLDKLLRPLFDKHICSTTIINGVYLIRRLDHKVKGIPIDAIRKLARIVLTENMFTYEKNSIKKLLVVQWDQHLL
jgi:hypothetical protein